MTRTVAFAAAGLAALLAACGDDKVEMQNASIGEVAAEMRKAGDDRLINPGKWQHSVTVLEMDIPGMPPEARSMIQNARKVQRFEHCLTPEQAKKPSEDFFAQANRNCRYEHFTMGGGKIDMKLNCTSGEARMTMVQSGEYDADSYTMEATQVVETGAAGMGGPMTIKARVEARRIGDCTAEEIRNAQTQGTQAP